MINLNENIPGCLNFKWKEALYLKEWDVFVFPDTLQVRDNLIKTLYILEQVRGILKAPIFITSCYRPERYNAHIKGARFSRHISGKAVDFTCQGYTADEVRFRLMGHLVRLNIRMEKLDGSSWVHIDTDCLPTDPLEKRYFAP